MADENEKAMEKDQAIAAPPEANKEELSEGDLEKVAGGTALVTTTDPWKCMVGHPE